MTSFRGPSEEIEEKIRAECSDAEKCGEDVRQDAHFLFLPVQMSTAMNTTPNPSAMSPPTRGETMFLFLVVSGPVYKLFDELQCVLSCGASSEELSCRILTGRPVPYRFAVLKSYL